MKAAVVPIVRVKEACIGSDKTNEVKVVLKVNDFIQKINQRIKGHTSKSGRPIVDKTARSLSCVQ